MKNFKSLLAIAPFQFSFSTKAISECAKATALVLATTAILLLIGRNVLGEAVIGFVYLVPISWATTRWGQSAGICAAVAAALAFDFFFIPPFFTFTVGSLEGWLVLIIFLAVAVVVVGRIQYGLAQAKARERDAIFMYELSASLAGLQNEEAVAHALASSLQQLFQAEMVQVSVHHDTPLVISVPNQKPINDKPDRVLPLIATHNLAGEICLWQGKIILPSQENRLLKNFATQGAFALERARLAQAAELRKQIRDTISSPNYV